MGAPSGCPALLWALVALLSAGMAGGRGPWEGAQWLLPARPHSRCDLAPSTARHLTFIPPVTVFPTMSPLNTAHGGRVCSTWGDFHYKTFDGDVFRFPGLCNYVFSAHCGSAYEDFNLQLRRGLLGPRPTITHIVLRSQGLVLEVSNGSVLINGWRVELPYSRAGLLVERSSAYVKINVRLMLTFVWNGEDSALLELDPKYANQTCGLCGDFNGLRAVSEFYAHNARLSPLQFGNLQKLDGPTEQCQDPLPSPAADNCTDEEGICRRTLLGPAFAPCHGLVDAEVYVAACTQDLCRCPSCPCATFAEYSRQCAHAGGQPQSWRGPDLCPQTCPLNTQHQECGSPCVDTCSNSERSQLCEDHCVDGCFCPPDTVLDDVTHTGCLPLRQCPCTHGGRIYDPGASFNTSCSSCTCSGGLWQCQDLPCPGTCSIQGGSHISTYDEKLYDVHGDCSYVLTKVCADSALAILAELRKCGLTDNENCLKAMTLSLNGGDTTVQIQANGGVFVNSIYTQLPVSVADVTVFRPSSFFILVQMGRWLQLQVQLVPIMQVFLWLDPAYRGQMCGLCGNFNQNQADDFRTVGGVVEATAAAFANTWKTQASCPNVKNSFEDPCSLSVENENYAQHWCSLLTSPAGPFSSCHSVLSPGPFHSNCMFDTCNCEKSEDCMCAALSSYVRACAARGVLLSGWRDGVCTKYASSCPKTQSYAHMVDSCQPTCRSLSQPDVSCDVAFVPVDGCVCPPGTFLDDAGDCVPAEACPCYLRGTVVAPGEVVHDNGVVCSCVSGRLSCLGATEQSTGCVAPMVFLDCSNTSADAPGAECVRSCHSLDVDCFSTHCVSGCVCPVGLLSDGSGGCVAKEDCPCLHNEAAYKPGEVIKVDCNTCTCRGRRWECSERPCLGTCVAYGDGHFLTFDGERYGFEGSCEYTLAQDYCAGSNAANGTFRIVTENVPCGTTGVTCSKAIKIFLGSYELILHEGTHKVLQRGPGGDLPYRVRYMGIYLTVETHSGVVVSWDRKTSVIIRLRHEYKGRVCGLCGNFDDNALNDFTTRSQSVVGDVLEFGNSWKFSPSCPDALASRDPCTANPYRKSWAQKQCSIINSATFSACRSQVDSTRYYEACVSDACACDSGGDCECFCTAVAAYAQACHEAGVCVSWRTPDVCPLFCDYYNPHGECEWHYQPCGAPCLKTCRNPSGLCLMDLPGLEGCYPKCPSSKPFFNEDQMKCVAQCSGCYDEDGNYYDVGKRVPTTENCQSCDCTSSGLQCTHSPEACMCTYEGRTYAYGDVIYNTTDGLGACLIAICRDNGTIVRRAVECPGTPPTTPFTFTFTSTAAPPSTTGLVPTLSTVCVWKVCHWSDWYDGGHPEPDMSGGDFETFENLRQRGYQVCLAPADIECQAQLFPGMPLEKLGQKVECSRGKGLTCLNSEQSPPLCLNYELRVLCCDYVPCGTSQSPSSQTPATSTQTTSTLGTTHPTTAVPTSQTPSTKLTTTTTPEGSSSAFPATTTWASTSQATTSCERKCQWTQWFDVDYPKYEEAGGDFETYEKIRGTGGAVCEQPQDIECEAENYPGQKPEEVGQRVHCDVRFGLVCRNDEQLGLFKMCYNYKMRVLCCRYSHCRVPTSTTSPTATASPSTATAATATTATEPTSVLTTTQTSTAQPPTETSLSTTGTPPTSMLPTPLTKTGTPAPTTASTGPPTSQGMTGCRPKCQWTEWFDVDFPTSGVMGGDIETYDNIRAAGGKLCQQPEKIACRAENYPEVSIDQIGQVLSCSLETGLVCRNEDQKGPFTMCFNYNIRVYCCDDVRHCPTTATPGLQATSTSGSLMPSVVPPTSSGPTTPCLCHAFGKFFLPGDIVYNKTDGAGCPFLAICNQHCDLDRFQGTCPTSSPPRTSASVPPTTPVVGCDRTIPPRKVNESWFLEDCTVARCEGDNRIILLGPRPMNSITCVNGHLPVKVQNQSHPCDYHYECECVCSGWGGAHYETFDGTSYSFLDNCTHVLVREIQPRYGNLRILLHNRFCEAAAHCPRALSIHYQPVDIVLSTSTGAGGQEESLILLNQTRVRQSFSKNGVTVTLTGATGMRVDIPAVGVSITFNGQVFQARLSYSRFNHNTEGQCGTCTNNRRDECRRPDGTMARTCQDMARSWLVSESSGEGCGVPTGLPITTSPLLPGTSTPAIQPSCPPEPLCELMLSPVFAGCHSLIPPGPYFNACVSDSCWPGRGRAVLCQSLEAYAELCRSRGVCPDWRNATHGLCDLACPPSKVYKSCGPVQPESCDSRSQSPLSVGLAEGCFCPDGHILFNSHRDICVPECPCVGPDGLPKFPGERWVSNCQDCVCDKGAVSVQCTPVECPTPDQPQECSEAGFVAVSRPLADKPCCMETLCVCNASTCPQSPPACRPGEKLVRTQVEDDCCPTFSCNPLLCTFNGTFYGVGATFQGVTPCHTCTCLSMDSRDPTMWCEEKACNTTCLQGFEYSTVAGQCCGECVQTACLAPDGQLVQLNETWVNSLVDNCTEYHCQARDGPPMLTPTPVVCPDVSTCKGILKKIGCCYSCVQTDTCQVHANMTVLRHRGCVTQAAVRVSFCEGSCPEVSRYSMEAQAGQCRCTCCQETRTHQEVVTMQCPDGTAFQHTYTHVDECSCVPACASSSQVLEDSVSTFPLLGSTTV
ncbi:unnamed protein product [Rangifer tarandus platyrhynchus]|uniref:Mucin-5B n=1 Tax=Rangifer tarandus platyrhynchus TaxID=3082113 RepID=A0ABN8Z686_RANTA|nr:unnamed protein product [Rangifer tarandus platyrhynchus]